MEKVVDLQAKKNERTFNKLRAQAEKAREEIARDPWPTIKSQKLLIKEQHELLMKIYSIVYPQVVHLESDFPEWPVDVEAVAICMVEEIRKAFDEQK